MTQTKIEGKFYPLQNDEWLKACKELKPAERDVLYYLRTLDPFGEKELELGVSEIALALGRDKGTVSRALKALDQKGWIDLQLIKVKVKLHSRCLHTTALPPHNSVVSTQLELSAHNWSCPDTTEVVSTQQSAETLTLRESQSSKTIKTIKTNQTGAGGENFCADATLCASIPQDLKVKLEELLIPLDSGVVKAIATHHISQAYGAAAHVENTWETVSNPRSVFLFQIAKQPVETLSSRLPVINASDFGFTVADIKRMYPHCWKDAATYYGVEVKADD